MRGTGELTVIGYSGAELGAEGLAALASATLVVGGARHLAAVPVPEGARTIRVGALEPALAALAGHEGNAVVVASGDPGFFGIVRRLRAGGLEVGRVIPAVSSVAAAFAAVRLDFMGGVDLAQIAAVEETTDAFHLSFGDSQTGIAYLLEIRPGDPQLQTPGTRR